MADLHGLDWAWWTPTRDALERLDCNFACRYLSHDSSKNLSRTEAEQLASWGIWSVVVWETSAKRAAAGRAAGVVDANTAISQAKACGIPDDRPIYFAVDYDTATPVTDVGAYFQGVASVLGVNRIGVYGSYVTVASLKKMGLATWLWQTYAWSNGKWYPGNHIEQYRNLDNYDHDRAKQADYGQWMPGRSPSTDMSLSIDDVKRIWKTDGVLPSPPTTQQAAKDAGRTVNEYWAACSYLKEIFEQNVRIETKLDRLLAQGPGAADAKAVVDELGKRLTGNGSA